MFNITNFTKETHLKSAGVYLITHNKTDVKYIGSTIGTFASRWRAHLRAINKGKGNTALCNVCKKYGIEGFRFSIVEEMNNRSEQEIRNREFYWINYYDTYIHGANCSMHTDCAFKGYDKQPYSEEQKQLYRDTCTTKKTVYMYDIDGNLLKVFESGAAADKYLGLRKGRVSCFIHKEYSLQGKYFFTYEPRDWNPGEIRYQKRLEKAQRSLATHRKNGWVVPKELRRTIRNSNPRKIPVALYDLEGNFIKSFVSQNECDDFLNLTRGTTSKVLKGKAKTLRYKYIPKITK